MRKILLVALALAACKGKSDQEIISKLSSAQAVKSPPPSEGSPAKKGTLKQEAFASWGVIPRTCSAEQALAKAKSKIKDGDTHVVTGTLEEMGWDKDHDSIQMKTAESDAAEIDKIKEGLIIGALDSPKRVSELASAALAVAKECNGWVIAMNNGTLYDAESGADGLAIGPVNARKLLALAAGKSDNELAYINTVGMNAVGLPELQLRGIPTAELKDAATLVNAAAQALIEQNDVTRDGELDVDASKLTGDWHAAELAKQGGSGKLTWKVQWVNADEDGNKLENPELQLIAPGNQDAGAVGLMAAIDTYFGKVEDKAVNLDEMRPELEKAGEHARAELKKLLPHFAKGVPAAEQLSVKAPFDTDRGGTEWMWVDVFKISKGVIEGTLNNDPNEVAALKSGAHVKVDLSKIADFIYRKDGEKSVGGFSLEVMRKHGMDVPSLDD